MTRRLPRHPGEWSPPVVLLVGLVGGPDDLSLRTHQWLDRAEVLFGGKRHLEAFASHPAAKEGWESSLDRSLDRIAACSVRHRTAVLASGDPFYFGIGRRIVGRLGHERVLAFPNVTAVQTLFARIGESWEDATVLSLHGRPGAAMGHTWLEQVRRHPKVVLYTDPRHTPDWIARALLEAGLQECALAVGEDLGTPAEKVSFLTVQEAAARSFSSLNVVAVLREPSGSAGADPGDSLPIFGLPEKTYAHEAGMITKLEVRAVVLAHLELVPDLVLWDLGAASGSIAIEAARLACPRGSFAVEQSESRFRELSRNIERLAPARIQALHGRALEIVESLPDPDRVFIGGSGGELVDLLTVIASRLKPGGIVVQTAVAFDTLETARGFWTSHQAYSLQLMQVQISHSVPIGRSQRLEPQNPVFLLKAVRRA